MPRCLAGPAAVAAFACATAGATAAPPPAGTIVFPSDRCDGGGIPVETLPGVNVCRTSIFRANPDGSGVTRLTRGSSPEDEQANVSGEGAAAWSPDGERIAFTRSTPNGARIFVMNVDGSDQRLLFADVPSYGNALNPAWSPDGRTIAFDSSAGLESGVFTYDLATGAVRRLTPTHLYAQVPGFTTDGRVSFFADLAGDDSDSADQRGTYSVKLDGTQLRRLTIGDLDLQAGGLQYSLDGNTAALATRFDARVYTVRANGRNLVNRSRFQGSGFPVWSADGSLLWAGPTQRDDVRPTVLWRLGRGAKGLGTAITSASGQSTDGVPSPWVPGAFVSDSQPPGAIVQVVGGRLLFVAFDQTGIARIDASIALRKGRRCRFVSAAGKLSAPRRCTRTSFARVKKVSDWQTRVADLPKGTYQVRFKLRDVLGNATGRSRARTATLR